MAKKRFELTEVNAFISMNYTSFSAKKYSNKYCLFNI